MALLKFKRSAVPAKVPALNDLDLGELAINTYDGKVYTKKDDGTPAIVEIGGNSNGITTITSADGSVTVTGTGATRDLSVAVAGSTTNVLALVRNNTGATLAKGTVVYINGSHGQNSTVAKAIATSDATSAQTLGLMTANLANNATGYVTVIGVLTGMDTSAFTDGQQLYLSPTTAGTFTATKPYAPQHLVYVAVVEHAHPTQGKLFVKVQNGYEMDELHDVSAQSPSNNHGLFYNTTSGLWENKSIATALGYTPANRAGDTFTGPITVNSGANQAILGSDGAIELTRGAGGAYIDFKDSTAEDFDVRLQASGNQLNISAAGGLTLNGAGVLTGITSGQVTTALGYTPYNATNPAGYITSSALSAYLPLTGGSLNVGGVSNTHQFLYNESGGEIQLIDSTGAGPILIDNVSGLARFYKVGSGAMSIGTTGANYLQYITNGAERMRISSSGDLGIGTSAPAGKLHVVAGANNSLLFRGAINYATGGSIYAVNEANSVVTPMELGASSFFLTGGNVGIGIISAAYQLQVQGLGQDTAALTDAGNKGGSLYIRANGTTSGSGGVLLFGTTFGNQTPFAAIKALVTDGGGNTTGDLAFSTRNATSDTALTERMRIALNGNVGVGTSAPSVKLDVVGNVLAREDAAAGAVPVLLRNSNTGNNTTKSSSALFQGTDTVGTVKNIGSIGFFPDDANYIGANLRFLVRSGDAAPTERMRITGGGLVGVNTTTPSTNFEVNGGLIAGSENRQTHPPTGPVGFKAQWNFTGGDGETDFYNLYSPAITSFRFYQTTGSGTAQLLYNMRPSSHEFYTGGTERFRINSTGGITSSDLSDAVGYKGLPQNQRTGAYTLALSDIGKHLYVTAGAFAVTLPADATLNFPVGTAITFVCEDAAKTIVPASGVALVLAGTGAATTGTRTLAVGAVATLLKVQANRWYISGSGVT
jgi:hypothetical protein